MKFSPFNRLIALMFQGNQKKRLQALVVIVIGTAFLATAILSYEVSSDSMRDQIVYSDLPLTSDTVYSQVQHDFLRPIQSSALMASDTFLRDWAIGGEKDLGAIQKYLAETKRVNGAFTTYFVSAVTHRYYVPEGVLKTISRSDAHDVWFFDLEPTAEDYVVEVDTDQDHQNALTVFINYRVFDYERHFLGIAGMGLNIDAMRLLIDHYQQQFGRKVYFLDRDGKLMLSGQEKPPFTDIKTAPGLSGIAPTVLGGKDGIQKYVLNGQTHLLNVRYVPELQWFLLVERVEDAALSAIRRTLYINLLIAALATTLVAAILGAAVSRFHAQLDNFATTDGLTGLMNRRAYELLFRQTMKEAKRAERPLCLVLFDLDHFKRINDQYGHQAGDHVIKSVAATIKARSRASDIACRWGGEELLLLLQDCRLAEAVTIAEGIRQEIVRVPIVVGAQVIMTTVSAGVAEMTSEESEESLLARADAGLYAAKRGGRNRVLPGGDTAHGPTNG